MYVGRIVVVGRAKDGRLAVLYRVSSRSYPNREAQVKDKMVSIVPKKGAEADVFKNPHITYNCLRIAGVVAVATNGSHTDPIAEKILTGHPIREAFAWSLLAFDYEKDEFNTPRIAAAVTRGRAEGYLGVVREDGLEVSRFPLQPGECYYVSTYETNRLSRMNCGEFDAGSAQEGAEFILGKGLFAEMSNPVTGVCALESQAGFEIAAVQARQ